MDTPSSPFSDGSYSIDSRVNQDLQNRPKRPRSRSSSRTPTRSRSRSRSRDRYRRRSRERRRRFRSSSRDRRGRSRRDSRSRSRSRRTEVSSCSRPSAPPPPVGPRAIPKEASAGCRWARMPLKQENSGNFSSQCLKTTRSSYPVQRWMTWWSARLFAAGTGNTLVRGS